MTTGGGRILNNSCYLDDLRRMEEETVWKPHGASPWMFKATTFAQWLEEHLTAFPMNGTEVSNRKDGEIPMYLTDKQVIAIKRKRGELNLSTVALGRELGLSRWTLDNIFKRNHRKVTPATYKKLSDWLINEYATADIKDSTVVAIQDK